MMFVTAIENKLKYVGAGLRHRISIAKRYLYKLTVLTPKKKNGLGGHYMFLLVYFSNLSTTFPNYVKLPPK